MIPQPSAGVLVGAAVNLGLSAGYEGAVEMSVATTPPTVSGIPPGQMFTAATNDVSAYS